MLNSHYEKQYIVGYIEKAEVINRDGFLCIKGTTKLVSFDDSIDVNDMFGKKFAQSENRGKNFSLSRDVFLERVKEKQNGPFSESGLGPRASLTLTLKALTFGKYMFW